MRIALFFGSFNPIHVGHLIIAQHIINRQLSDELWFVVSPHNPHKKKQTLLADYHRLELVRRATETSDKLRACDIEFNLPQPSYTIDTLTYLKEKYPQHEFVLLMGEDNLRTLHKWKNYEQILKQFEVLVYPRMKEEGEEPMEINLPGKITVMEDVSMLRISASHVRRLIANGESPRFLLTEEVRQYCDEMHFYKS